MRRAHIVDILAALHAVCGLFAMLLAPIFASFFAWTRPRSPSTTRATNIYVRAISNRRQKRGNIHESDERLPANKRKCFFRSLARSLSLSFGHLSCMRVYFVFTQIYFIAILEIVVGLGTPPRISNNIVILSFLLGARIPAINPSADLCVRFLRCPSWSCICFLCRCQHHSTHSRPFRRSIKTATERAAHTHTEGERKSERQATQINLCDCIMCCVALLQSIRLRRNCFLGRSRTHTSHSSEKKNHQIGQQ